MASGVAAVSFDADNTLWDFTAVMRHALGIALAQVRAWFPGQASDALTVDEMIEIRNDVATAHAGDWSRLEDIRCAAFEETLRRIDADTGRAGELNAVYLRHRFEDIRLFPDVLPCLNALPVDLPVGLLSNGNSYPERCGLDGRFSFVVFAQEHRVAKPDPRLFHIAAEAVGCATADLLHVGDGEADVVGAHRAGCRSVLVHRSGELPDFAHLADVVVPDLGELPEVIVELTGARPPRRPTGSSQR